MELQKKYVGAVNHILKGLDFRKLEKSCNSYEQTYAKEVLCKLHQAFVDTYGTDFLPHSEEPYVSMPAVLRGKKSGDVTLGLVVVDTTSAGALVDTVLFTPKASWTSAAACFPILKSGICFTNTFPMTTGTPRRLLETSM